jgi:2-polyprenyl-6-hydroxyphenyl methylase/3-demethylubiquinone-9 3-methyltransferase
MKNAADQYDEYYEDVEKSAPFAEEMEGDKSTRRNLALEYFKRFSAKNILDAGCGPGFDAVFFLKNGFKVHACDISKNAISYASSNNPGPKYFFWDAEKSSIHRKYDGIYAFEVIEHVFDYDPFLKNLYESLNNDGILVLSTPNVLAPRNRIKMLIGNDEWFSDKHHVHFFSPTTLRKSLERNGFKPLEIISTGKISFLGVNFGGSIIAVAKK